MATGRSGFKVVEVKQCLFMGQRLIGRFLQCNSITLGIMETDKLVWRTCSFNIDGDKVEDIDTGASERIDKMVNRTRIRYQ